MSGSNQQQTTSQSGPPPELMPYLQGYMGAGQSLLNQPYTPYQGPRVAPFTQMQNQAFQGIQGNMYGSPITSAANSNLMSILGGSDYNNPYLESEIQRGSRGVTDRFNQATNSLASRFSGGGAFGGSAHQQAQDRANEALATGLSDLEGGMRYNNFNQARQNQFGAINQAFQNQGQQNQWLQDALRAGSLQQGYGQQLIDSLYGDYREQRDYPWQQLDRYGSLLSRVLGGAGTVNTTTSPGSDRVSQGLGSAALLASLFR